MNIELCTSSISVVVYNKSLSKASLGFILLS